MTHRIRASWILLLLVAMLLIPLTASAKEPLKYDESQMPADPVDSLMWIAETQNGYTEGGTNYDCSSHWCAAYVSWCLQNSNISTIT